MIRKRLITSLLTVGACCALQMQAEKSDYVGFFDAISAIGPVDVTVKCLPDSAGIVIISAPEESELKFSTRKGKLTVSSEDEFDHPSLRPKVTAYADFLIEVSSEENADIYARLATSQPQFSANVTGNGKVTIENIKATNVKATLSTGNGTIALSGVTVNSSYSLVGSGAIEASRLRADIVKCSSTGSGYITCEAIDNLDVKGLGSTKIYYKGEPDIKKLGNTKIFPYSEFTPPVSEETLDEEEQPVKSSKGKQVKKTPALEESETVKKKSSALEESEPTETIEEEEIVILEDDEPTVVDESELEETVIPAKTSKGKGKKANEIVEEIEDETEEAVSEEVTIVEEEIETPAPKKKADKKKKTKKVEIEEEEASEESIEEEAYESQSSQNSETSQTSKTSQSSENPENSGRKVAKKRLSKKLNPKVEPLNESAKDKNSEDNTQEME